MNYLLNYPLLYALAVVLLSVFGGLAVVIMARRSTAQQGTGFSHGLLFVGLACVVSVLVVVLAAWLLWRAMLLPHPSEYSLGFHIHVLLALAAYGLLGTAAVHAGVMLWQQHHLHAQQGKAWVQRVLDELPPVVLMESILFRQLWAGFVLLSLSLVSGFAFAPGPIGFAQVLNHKTLFALAAWLTFAVLLAGRMALGWRGRVVLRACLGGYCALVLAYFGTQFVLQVVLQRGSL